MESKKKQSRRTDVTSFGEVNAEEAQQLHESLVGADASKAIGAPPKKQARTKPTGKVMTEAETKYMEGQKVLKGLHSQLVQELTGTREVLKKAEGKAEPWITSLTEAVAKASKAIEDAAAEVLALLGEECKDELVTDTKTKVDTLLASYRAGHLKSLKKLLQ